MRIPTKVIVAAVLLLIGGAFGVVFGFISVLVGGLSWLTGILPFRDTLAAWGGGAFVNGLIDFVIGVAELVAGIGLFLAQSWAWWLAVIVAVAAAIGPLISLFSGHFLSVFGLIVPAVILLILMSPDVRRTFGQITA
jgi:hypothetical protein